MHPAEDPPAYSVCSRNGLHTNVNEDLLTSSTSCEEARRRHARASHRLTPDHTDSLPPSNVWAGQAGGTSPYDSVLQLAPPVNARTLPFSYAAAQRLMLITSSVFFYFSGTSVAPRTQPACTCDPARWIRRCRFSADGRPSTIRGIDQWAWGRGTLHGNVQGLPIPDP